MEIVIFKLIVEFLMDKLFSYFIMLNSIYIYLVIILEFDGIYSLILKFMLLE